jgi:hypothetical protein
MVDMFVGNDDGLKRIGLQITLNHSPFYFTAAQTGIHENRLASSGDMNAVAFTTARQHAHGQSGIDTTLLHFSRSSCRAI